jgi:hypothetical protein
MFMYEGNYNDKSLVSDYSKVLQQTRLIYKSLPLSLCHDDQVEIQI